MTTIAQGLNPIERGSLGLGVPTISLVRVVKLIRLWTAKSAQRRHLATLTLRELEDVGISPEAAAAEAAKAFWR